MTYHRTCCCVEPGDKPPVYCPTCPTVAYCFGNCPPTLTVNFVNVTMTATSFPGSILCGPCNFAAQVAVQQVSPNNQCFYERAGQPSIQVCDVVEATTGDDECNDDPDNGLYLLGIGETITRLTLGCTPVGGLQLWGIRGTLRCTCTLLPPMGGIVINDKEFQSTGIFQEGSFFGECDCPPLGDYGSLVGNGITGQLVVTSP